MKEVEGEVCYPASVAEKFGERFRTADALAEAVSAFRNATVRAEMTDYAHKHIAHLSWPEYRDMAYASDMYEQATRREHVKQVTE